MYEIIANSVTSGLVIELGRIFPNVTRYREVVPAQFLVYPHFFVNQLTLDIAPERRNHWRLSYLATIRHHVAADPASVSGSLQQQLDDIGIQLMAELESIAWDGMPINLTGRRVEKVDGNLHFFCNITVMATKPIELDPVQENLEMNITKTSE